MKLTRRALLAMLAGATALKAAVTAKSCTPLVKKGDRIPFRIVIDPGVPRNQVIFLDSRAWKPRYITPDDVRGWVRDYHERQQSSWDVPK